MRYLAAAVALATGIAAPVRADVEVTVTCQSREWMALAGRQENGRATCAMLSQQASRTILFGYAAGDPFVRFGLTKHGWSIPTGRQVRVTIQLGSDQAQTLTASATPDGAGLLVRLRLSDLSLTARNLSTSGSISIGFPEGNEVSWHFQSVGIGEVVKAFVQCVDETAATSGNTQPFR